MTPFTVKDLDGATYQVEALNPEQAARMVAESVWGPLSCAREYEVVGHGLYRVERVDSYVATRVGLGTRGS